MSRSALEWYDQLARGLLWAAGIVLLLALAGAVLIAGSDSALPGFENVERQGRGIAALAALGGGLTSAGLLGGLGAILRLLAADRLTALGPAPEAERERPQQAGLFDDAERAEAAEGRDAGASARRRQGSGSSGREGE